MVKRQTKGGDALKRLSVVRREKGLSQAKVARAAGIDQATMSRIESGRYVPYPSELQRVADALGFEGDPQELLAEVTQYVFE